MQTLPRDTVQEYEVPLGVTALRVGAESDGPGQRSNSVVVVSVRPGATVRLRLTCLPG
jgi:hypothetical protein